MKTPFTLTEKAPRPLWRRRGHIEILWLMSRSWACRVEASSAETKMILISFSLLVGSDTIHSLYYPNSIPRLHIKSLWDLPNLSATLTLLLHVMGMFSSVLSFHFESVLYQWPIIHFIGDPCFFRWEGLSQIRSIQY